MKPAHLVSEGRARAGCVAGANMQFSSTKSRFLCGIASAVICASTTAFAQTKPFDVPAEDANKAIPEFARQAGIQIIAPGDQLKGVRTSGVKGKFEARVALAQLLRGTGTKVASDDGQTIVLTADLKNVPAATEQVAAAEPTQTAALTGDASETVVVTGMRGGSRSVTSSPVPIDVISASQISGVGAGLDLKDKLANLVPSFEAPAVASSSWDGVARAAGLRGFGGAQVLVLVDGKRRHNSSLINLHVGNPSLGSNPVDLDLIADDSIDHIEVLRDGAAAQYGSDAIAGVINIILKKDDSSGSLEVSDGQHFDTQGQSVDAGMWHGFKLGENGYLTLAANFSDQKADISNSAATGTFFFPLAGGVADPRELTVNRYGFNEGLPRIDGVNTSANAGYKFNDIEFYSTETFSYRNATAGQAYRRPNTNQDVIAIYPQGFTPYYTLKEIDYQALAGAKSVFDNWAWDLSTTYGMNHVGNGAIDSLNASLGPTSPTSFHTFSSDFSQWTNNFDVVRDFSVGLATPLTVSWGLEHRWENFTTVAGDPLAYQNGGYAYPANYGGLIGTYAQVGAQGAITLIPSDAANLSRNVFAAYFEASTKLTDSWLVDFAGRTEKYSDVSQEVFSGKFSTRYEITDWLALRGTVSNGFRAPSLAQEGFAQTSSQLYVVNGVTQVIPNKTVPVNSPIATALGAKPLTPETSRDFSVGFSLTPMSNFTFTFDAYDIHLYHRIMETGFLSGTAVNAILAKNGYSPYYVKFFANALNTDTEGFDIVGTYATPIVQVAQQDVDLHLTASYNYNYSRVTALAPTPSQLAGLGFTLYDAQTIGSVTSDLPLDKFILAEDLSWNAFDFNIRETRYGQYSYIVDAPSPNQTFAPNWLFDIEMGYHFNDAIMFSIGADNVLNRYPPLTIIPTTTGSSPYASDSPYGFYGGYYYARISYKF